MRVCEASDFRRGVVEMSLFWVVAQGRLILDVSGQRIGPHIQGQDIRADSWQYFAAVCRPANTPSSLCFTRRRVCCSYGAIQTHRMSSPHFWSAETQLCTQFYTAYGRLCQRRLVQQVTPSLRTSL